MTDWPAWIEAIATAVGAIAVAFAALEWRSGRADRRDNEANQARLQSVELRNPPPVIPSMQSTGALAGQTTGTRFLVVVHNYSDEPVFSVTLESFRQVLNGKPVIAQPDFHGLTRDTQVVEAQNAREVKVVDAQAETDFDGIEWYASSPSAHDPGRSIQVTVRFKDARGRRWRKEVAPNQSGFSTNRRGGRW